MSDNNIKNIQSIYEELKEVRKILKNKNSWFDDEGFSSRVNEIIDRVKIYCPEIENIESYKIIGRHLPDRGVIVDVTVAQTKVGSLIGRIKGLNDFNESSLNTGNTFIQNQTQSQSLSVVLDLQEKIISEINNHEEGSEERSFLEKMKNKLSEVKNITDILSTALSIGSEFGLSPDTIKKLLGL